VPSGILIYPSIWRQHIWAENGGVRIISFICVRCGSGSRARAYMHGGPEVLRDVAIATNIGTQFAITGFVGYNFGCMIASDTLFDSRGGLTGSWYPI